MNIRRNTSLSNFNTWNVLLGRGDPLSGLSCWSLIVPFVVFLPNFGAFRRVPSALGGPGLLSMSPHMRRNVSKHAAILKDNFHFFSSNGNSKIFKRFTRFFGCTKQRIPTLHA
jgi:hypothetical protein